MPKLVFTPKELKGYFNGELKHHFYDESVKKAKKMQVHSDGKYPEELIEERRPNEPSEVKDYRKKIWVPKTKPVLGKIISSLSKIRRSSDWSIRFEGIEEFSKISDEESLKVYGEEAFPYFTSMTNWLFAVALKKYADDPNAVVFVKPIETVVEENEFIRPFPVIFDSCDVLEFVDEDHAILHNPLGSTYNTRSGVEKGKSYYLVTIDRIRRIDQINGKDDYGITLDFVHNLGMLPVFRIGAIITESEGNNYLYESRIAAIIPELDEAVREYSDLQAAKVLHIYPERYEFTSHECGTCKGRGTIPNTSYNGTTGKPFVECDQCNGVGYKGSSPYSKILIRPMGAMESSNKIPDVPAGYIEKDVEIVELMEKGVEHHIYKALSAINFEFLQQSPLNQSGTAKEVDKDELNNTVHSIAEDLVSIMDRIYKLIALYRYQVQYSADDIIERMLPKINVPEKFDILSSTHLEQELSSAKTSKLNPIILNALEVEYANKKFNNDPDIRDRLMLILELDPLPNITEDEKMSRLSNKGITQEDYVISSKIVSFVQQAIDENENFPELPLAQQKEKMLEYARAQITAQDEVNKILGSVIQDGGLGELNNNTQPNGAIKQGILAKGQQSQQSKQDTDKNEVDDIDQIGKLPLAIQQLSLAAQRAADTGNTALAARLNKKIDELLKSVGI